MLGSRWCFFFSLINNTVTMTRITMVTLIPSIKIVKTDAVTATPYPLEPMANGESYDKQYYYQDIVY